MSASDNFLSAIDILIKNAVEKADYDKTVKANILSCEDSVTGKYKISYQGSTLYAFAANPELIYKENTTVYILVPGNDITKRKTIIGSVTDLGQDYTPVADRTAHFEYLSGDCIIDNIQNEPVKYNLSKITDNVFYDLLYAANTKNGVEYNFKSIDVNQKYNGQHPAIHIIRNNEFKISLQQNTKTTKTMVMGASFQTSLSSRNRSGNYGICYTLAFKTSTPNNFIYRPYVLDVSQMSGTPYVFTLSTAQTFIAEIDSDNFDHIENIFFFATNFEPNEEDYISISNLDLYAARYLDESEVSSLTLNIVAPEGVLIKDKLPLKTEVKKGGVIQNFNTNNIEYYWYVEQADVTPVHKYYSPIGGDGWITLNKKYKNAVDLKIQKIAEYNKEIDNIKKLNKTDEEKQVLLNKAKITYDTDISQLFEQYPEAMSNSLLLDANLFLTKERKIKCVAKYTPTTTGDNQNTQSVMFSGSRVIFNEKAEYSVELELEGKAIFNNEEEHSVLRAKLVKDNILQDFKDYNLQWVRTSLNGQTTLLNVDSGNKKQEKTVAARDFYKNAIYSCVVYNKNNQFIGQASQTFSFSNDVLSKYSLYITGADVSWVYDENGDSPVASYKGSSVTIPPLSFFIVNNETGERIEGNKDNFIEASLVKWTVSPEKERLFKIVANNQSSKTEFFGYTLNYTLIDQYNINKQSNDILLEVTYNNEKLTAYEHIKCFKIGDPGVSGSAYYAEITADTIDYYKPYYMVLRDEKNEPNINWRNNKDELIKNLGQNVLKARLYYQGKEINYDNVKWSLLATNKAFSKIFLDTSNDNKITPQTKQTILQYEYPKSTVCDLIKAEITYTDEGGYKRHFYAVEPIAYIKTFVAGYKVEIQDSSGFKFIKYSSDGTNGTYDKSIPFTVNIKYNNEDKTSTYTYDWKTVGLEYNKKPDEKSVGISDYLIIEKKNNDEPNNIAKVNLKPSAPIFNGSCTSLAVECRVYADTAKKNLIAYIHLPIFGYLNTSGYAALNDWDGTSIEINQDGGYIMSPQMGAGSKDDEGKFTGILMGKMHDGTVDNGTKDKSGILGFNKSEQTIFLDAETGTATFGNIQSGQIVIDPTRSEISGGGYYNEKHVAQDQGLLIDLNDPAIRYGRKKEIISSVIKTDDTVTVNKTFIPTFSVDKDGVLTCCEARIYGSFFAGEHDSKGNYSVFSANSAGTQITSKTENTYMTLDSQSNTFILESTDSEGKIESGLIYRNGQLTITGKITATSGEIGGWLITKNAIIAKGGGLELHSDGRIVGTTNGDQAGFGEWSDDTGSIRIKGNKLSTHFKVQPKDVGCSSNTCTIGEFKDKLKAVYGEKVVGNVVSYREVIRPQGADGPSYLSPTDSHYAILDGGYIQDSHGSTLISNPSSIEISSDVGISLSSSASGKKIGLGNTTSISNYKINKIIEPSDTENSTTEEKIDTEGILFSSTNIFSYNEEGIPIYFLRGTETVTNEKNKTTTKINQWYSGFNHALTDAEMEAWEKKCIKEGKIVSGGPKEYKDKTKLASDLRLYIIRTNDKKANLKNFRLEPYTPQYYVDTALSNEGLKVPNIYFTKNGFQAVEKEKVKQKKSDDIDYPQVLNTHRQDLVGAINELVERPIKCELSQDPGTGLITITETWASSPQTREYEIEVQDFGTATETVTKLTQINQDGSIGFTIELSGF